LGCALSLGQSTLSFGLWDAVEDQNVKINIPQDKGMGMSDCHAVLQ